jgi:lipid-binding SYLF domain-containing protein
VTEKQTYILAAAIIIGGFLLGGRYGYDVVATNDNDVTFKINRLSGSTMLCGVGGGRAACIPLNNE